MVNSFMCRDFDFFASGEMCLACLLVSSGFPCDMIGIFICVDNNASFRELNFAHH